jgi:Tol biopolymer transport system component
MLAKKPSRRSESVHEIGSNMNTLLREEITGPVPVSLTQIKTKYWLGGLAAVCAISVGVWLATDLFRAPTEPLAPPRRITNISGFKGPARFSPDGQHLVFSRNRRGTFKVEDNDLYIKELDGGIASPLTEGPAQDNHASWCSENQIIFVRRTEGERSLYETRLTGRPGDEQLLKELNDAEINYPATDCSPDGKYIAYQDRESPEEPESIYLFLTETQETIRRTSPPEGSRDFHPVFTPDGKKLAFARARVPNEPDGQIDWSKGPDFGWNIWLVPVDGGEEEKLLAKDEKSAWGFDWMPDGEEIVYAHGGANPRLWRVSISSGKSYPLLPEERCFWPNISPQGDRLAFCKAAWDQDIWRLSLSRSETGAPSQSPLIESPADDLRADISPDRQWITFSSNRSGRENEVWICDTRGERLNRVARGEDPQWSPNGDSIAFTQWQEERGALICTIRRNRTAFLSRVEGEFPSWSENGKWIYFNRDGSLWKISVHGEGQPISMNVEADRWCFEKDGFVYYRRGSDFLRIPQEGGPEEPLLEDVGETSWGVGKSGIYYASHKKDPAEFRRFDPRTGKDELLEQAVGEVGKWQRLSVSFDEQWLVYSTQGMSSDIFMIENFH